MANTFGILAALVLCFASWVAHKNQGALKTEIDQIKTESRTKKKNQETFQDLSNDIEGLNKEREDFENETAAKQSEIDKQNAQNADVETQIADKEAQAIEAEARAAEANEIIKELGETRELIPQMKRLKSEIADLDDKLSVFQADVSSLENSKNEATTKSEDLSAQLSARNTGKSYFVSTRIRSVYRNWGFVTLGSGDNSGVVAKSKLKVVRGDDEIAQLIVTAVEENTAAASIIPSSVNPDLDISVGDVVVPFEDTEEQTASN